MNAVYKVRYAPQAVEDIFYWSEHDKKKLLRIQKLIENIMQTPMSGLGKPERLKHQLAGAWSRRIDAVHRFVYQFNPETREIWILQARYHYSE